MNIQDASDGPQEEDATEENIKKGIILARDEIWNNLLQISQATHLAEQGHENSEDMNKLIRRNVETIITTFRQLVECDLSYLMFLRADRYLSLDDFVRNRDL